MVQTNLIMHYVPDLRGRGNLGRARIKILMVPAPFDMVDLDSAGSALQNLPKMGFKIRSRLEQSLVSIYGVKKGQGG